MNNHNNLTAALESEIDRPTEPAKPFDAHPLPWHAEVGEFLTQAARLCVQHGVDLDGFMKGAWSAYVEARPGMRDYLEELHLMDQLDEIRKAGRMGEA